MENKQPAQLPFDTGTQEMLSRFCERWKITRMELFGSVARGEASPDSDIDLMATFHPNARWSLFDLAAMEVELDEIFGRKASLTTRAAIEKSRNWIRRKAILNDAQLLYAA